MCYIMLNAVCNIVLGDYKSSLFSSRKIDTHSLLILEFHFLIKENIYLQKNISPKLEFWLQEKNSSYKNVEYSRANESLYNCRPMRLNFNYTLEPHRTF